MIVRHDQSGSSNGGVSLPRLATAACCCVMAVVLSGCANHNGTLALDSGDPITSVRGRQAIEEPVYAVHIGERAMLRFTWQFDTCDYAILLDESTGEYFDCGPPLGGRFEWGHTFIADAERSESYRLIVEGYLRVGHRDRLPVRGDLKEHKLTTDPQDSLIARAVAHVQTYQSEVLIDVAPQAERPAWDLTKLVLTRDSGKETIVRRQVSDKRGFRVEHAGEPEAEWRVRYLPLAGEINHRGRTKARLLLADETGRTHEFEHSFETP